MTCAGPLQTLLQSQGQGAVNKLHQKFMQRLAHTGDSLQLDNTAQSQFIVRPVARIILLRKPYQSKL